MPSNRRSLLAASNADSGGPFDVYYLVVGGGGGGASGNTADEAGGGGGGGGVLTNYPSSPYEIETGIAYTVTVGAGGTGRTSTASNGANSVFDSFTAIGGGAGDDNRGLDGGSGGGSGADDTTDSAGSNATIGQGNSGGASQFLGEYGVAGGGGGAAADGSSAQRTDGSYMAMFQVTPSTADFAASPATKGIASNQPYSIPLPAMAISNEWMLMTLFGDANGGGLTTPSGWTALSNFTNLGNPDIYGGVFLRTGYVGGPVTVNDDINSRSVSYMCHRISGATSISAGEFSDSDNGRLAGDSTSNRCHVLTVAHEANSQRPSPTGFIANNQVIGSGYATSQRMGFDRSDTTSFIYAGDVGTAGNGGNGTSNSITGTAVTYAGGGGGGDASRTGSGSTGGSGGGGNGGGTSTAGQDGAANTGGGGGGSATNTISGAGNGGSGVVILRFDSAQFIASVTGTLAYSTATDGTDTVATFTGGTGTVTFA